MTCLLPSNIPPLAILFLSCWFRFTGFVRRTSIFRLQTHETTLDERECERAGTSLMAAMSGSRYPRQTFLALISPGRHLLLEISGTPLQPSMFSHSIFIFFPPVLDRSSGWLLWSQFTSSREIAANPRNWWPRSMRKTVSCAKKGDYPLLSLPPQPSPPNRESSPEYVPTRNCLLRVVLTCHWTSNVRDQMPERCLLTNKYLPNLFLKTSGWNKTLHDTQKLGLPPLLPEEKSVLYLINNQDGNIVLIVDGEVIYLQNFSTF